MKKLTNSNFSRLRHAVFFGLTFLFAASAVTAQEQLFVAETRISFVSECCYDRDVSFNGLSARSQRVSETTQNRHLGFVAALFLFPGLPNAPFNGDRMYVRMNFSYPAGVGEQVFVAKLTGVTNSILVNFEDLPRKVSYSGIHGSGEFYITINDFAVRRFDYGVILPPGVFSFTDNDRIKAGALTGAITLDKPSSTSFKLQEQVAELQGKLAERDATLAERDATIALNNQEIITLQGQIQNLQQQLNDKNSDLEAARATILQIQNALSLSNAANQTLTAQNQALQSQIAVSVIAIEQNFRSVFMDPAFTIPGSTPALKFQNLMNAIKGLNGGHKKALYKSLGGKKNDD